jgi:hypothetical protein
MSVDFQVPVTRTRWEAIPFSLGDGLHPGRTRKSGFLVVIIEAREFGDARLHGAGKYQGLVSVPRVAPEISRMRLR